MQNGEVCFCKRDIISVCAAGGREQQKNCCFYQKATFKNACMYFVLDAYCDCVEAQRNTNMLSDSVKLSVGSVYLCPPADHRGNFYDVILND